MRSVVRSVGVDKRFAKPQELRSAEPARGVGKCASQNRRNSAMRSFSQATFEKIFECVWVVLYGVITELKTNCWGNNGSTNGRAGT